MIDGPNTETFIYILKDKFQIYLFDKTNLKKLYEEEIKFHDSDYIDFKNLNKFIENNIFKIERLIKGFVKNISLVVDSKNITNIDIGLKRKNYNLFINKKDLQNSITETKELFKKNFPDQTIMHIIIKRFLVNEKNHLILEDKIKGDHFCLEIQFISINNDFVIQAEKIFEKYQIKINQYLDSNYIFNFFKNDNYDSPHMAYKIQCGYNQHEVLLIPKSSKKSGFFEKFFQLFS